MKTARLLIDPPLTATANMARDEWLLGAVTEAHKETVLRFYAWDPPAISLGYFQKYSEYEALPPPAGALSVVRRTTGGGAILHDLEVTYSLTIPIDDPLVEGRPNHLYEIAHQAIIAAVGGGARMLGNDHAACDDTTRRGPFFCFTRRHGLDVVIDDPRAPGGTSKIAGSAQRRGRRAILQHGSIMLDSRFSQQPVATWSGLQGPIDFDAAIRRLLPAFETALGRRLLPSEWRGKELQAAEQIEMKYAGDAWTRNRRR